MPKLIEKYSFYLLRLVLNLIIFTYISIKTAFPNLGETKFAYLDIPIDSDIGLIRKTYGMADAGSYLDIAISLANFRNIQPEQYFYIHTWSPGQSIILALAILASKYVLSVYTIIFLINYGIWVAIISFLTKRLSSIRQIVLFYMFFLTFLVSSDFSIYFYSMLFYSENIGNSLLFLALLMISWFIKNESLIWYKYTLAGFILGVSILVRYTSETGLFLLLLLILIWLLLNKLLPTSVHSKFRVKQNQKIKILKLVFISFFIALLTTIPWRILNISLYDMDTIRLSNSNSWTIYSIWAPNSSPDAEYWSNNGLNWACKIDSAKCDAINMIGLNTLTPKTVIQEALKSAIEHPKSYLLERFKYMKIHYFEGGFNILEYQKYFSFLSLLSILFFPVLLLNLKFRTFDNFLITIIWFSFLINQIVIYAIIHYEYRYFIVFKFLVFGYIFSILFKKQRNYSKQLIS